MNSVVWPGKLTGTIIFEPILERLGYKKTAILVAVIQIVALISKWTLPPITCYANVHKVELTAKEWQQYCVGRVFAYLVRQLIYDF